MHARMRTTFLQYNFRAPSGIIAKKKNSLKECAFVNLALKIQCHVVKLQTAFSAILPTE